MKNMVYGCLRFFLVIFFFALFSSCSCSSGNNDTENYILHEDGVVIENGMLRITQYGISWYIQRSNNVPYTEGDTDRGKFANGDWWVAGPVRVIGINPPSTLSHGRVKNGSMLNPTTSTGDTQYDQGFDNNCGAAAPYNAALNAGRPGGKNLSPANPLSISTGSLVSSISIDATQWPQLKTAAVLTVVSADSLPVDGDFRPPYSGTDKSVKHNISDLNRTLLKKIPRPATNTYSPDPSEVNLSIETVEKYFERVWLDFIPGFSNQPIQPADNMPAYGREISIDTGRAALFLHLDYPDEEKETLLIRFVQRGIDLYGVVANGGTSVWYNAGGHASGRKWPILFAGMMLGDAGMQGIGQKSGDYINHYDEETNTQYGPSNAPPDYIYFGEDDQTFAVTGDDIKWTTGVMGPGWDPDRRNIDPVTRNCRCEPYTTADLGMPEWAISHATQPWRSDRDWGAEYRGVTAVSWAGWILAARIMNAQVLWNHDVLFDYQDRYMAVTADAPTATVDPPWRTAVNAVISTDLSQKIQGWWATHPGTRQYSPFVIEMWDTYRDHYDQH